MEGKLPKPEEILGGKLPSPSDILGDEALKKKEPTGATSVRGAKMPTKKDQSESPLVLQSSENNPRVGILGGEVDSPYEEYAATAPERKISSVPTQKENLVERRMVFDQSRVDLNKTKEGLPKDATETVFYNNKDGIDYVVDKIAAFGKKAGAGALELGAKIASLQAPPILYAPAKAGIMAAENNTKTVTEETDKYIQETYGDIESASFTDVLNDPKARLKLAGTIAPSAIGALVSLVPGLQGVSIPAVSGTFYASSYADAIQDSRNKGLSEPVGELRANAYAAVEAAFEALELGAVLGKIGTKTIANSIANKAVLDLAKNSGGQITQEIVEQTVGTAVKDVLGKIATRVPIASLSEGTGEAATLAGQKGVDAAIDYLADTELNPELTFNELKETFVAGALGGATLGGAISTSQAITDKKKGYYNTVVAELSTNPTEGKRYEMLDRALQLKEEGKINDREFDNFEQVVNGVYDIASKIPPKVSTPEKRKEAINLINDKNKYLQELVELKKEMVQSDEGFAPYYEQRISGVEDVIRQYSDNLTAIANGQPVKEINLTTYNKANGSEQNVQAETQGQEQQQEQNPKNEAVQQEAEGQGLQDGGGRITQPEITTQDAIQEQSTTEIPVQSETRTSEEVRQGDGQPQLQETAQQSQAQEQTEVEPFLVEESIELSPQDQGRNGLLDIVYNYNNKDIKYTKEERADLRAEIIQKASQLGLQVNEIGKEIKITDGTKKINRKPTVKVTARELTPDEVDQVTNIIRSNVFEPSAGGGRGQNKFQRANLSRLGLTFADVSAAKADLAKGKTKSIPLSRVLQAFDKARQEGGVEIVIGSGADFTAVDFIPYDNLLQSLDDVREGFKPSELQAINEATDQIFNNLTDEQLNEIERGLANETQELAAREEARDSEGDEGTSGVPEEAQDNDSELSEDAVIDNLLNLDETQISEIFNPKICD